MGNIAGAGVGSTVMWGISESVQGIKGSLNAGIITSWNENREAVTAPCENEIGQRIGERRYDNHITADCTFQVSSEANITVGTPVTIAGRQYLVKSIRKTETNKDYIKYSAQLEGWGIKFQIKNANGFDPQNAI